MRIHTPFVLVLLAVLVGLPAQAQPVNVQPIVETQPVVRGGSASQDVALWINSDIPEQSLFLVADPVVGLISYRLDGSEYQALLSDGVATGVDVHDGFALPGVPVPLVVAANETLQALTAYVVDPLSLELRRVDTGTLRVTGFSPRTVTLFKSPTSGTLYAFTSDANGTMQQLALTSDLDGGVASTPVRNFEVGGAVAGAVADDEQGYLFVAQQNEGIWRYSAEPDGGSARVSVATATAPLTAPLGGLSLYSLPGTQGYLLAASAGGNQVVVYNRQAPHESVGSFAVVQDGGLDEVTGPTTVEATSIALGPSFPAGMVAVHDAVNNPLQNDKLVSWGGVANAFSPPLQTSLPDGGTDGGVPDGGKGGGGGSVSPGGGSTFPTEDSGCSCSAASVPGALLFVVAGLALLSRRRRA